jgi:hypothetical protein
MLNKEMFFLTGLCSKLERKVIQQMDIKMERSKTDIIGAQDLEGRTGGHQKDKVNMLFCCYQQARRPEQTQQHVQKSSVSWL